MSITNSDQRLKTGQIHIILFTRFFLSPSSEELWRHGRLLAPKAKNGHWGGSLRIENRAKNGFRLFSTELASQKLIFNPSNLAYFGLSRWFLGWKLVKQEGWGCFHQKFHDSIQVITTCTSYKWAALEKASAFSYPTSPKPAGKEGDQRLANLTYLWPWESILSPRKLRWIQLIHLWKKQLKIGL